MKSTTLTLFFCALFHFCKSQSADISSSFKNQFRMAAGINNHIDNGGFFGRGFDKGLAIQVEFNRWIRSKFGVGLSLHYDQSKAQQGIGPFLSQELVSLKNWKSGLALVTARYILLQKGKFRTDLYAGLGLGYSQYPQLQRENSSVDYFKTNKSSFAYGVGISFVWKMSDRVGFDLGINYSDNRVSVSQFEYAREEKNDTNNFSIEEPTFIDVVIGINHFF